MMSDEFKQLGKQLGKGIDRNLSAIRSLRAKIEDLTDRVAELEEPTIDPPPDFGNVVKAESGSQKDIRAAVDKANPGDVVEIPRGEWAWSDSLTLKKPVHLRGAGREKTIITRNKGPDLKMLILEGDGFKWSKIGMIGTAGFASKEDTGLTIKGTDFLVWASHFQDFGWSCLALKGRKAGVIQKGVVYNSAFQNAVPDFGLGYGISAAGHNNNYDLPVQPGSGDQIYVEDCDFKDCRHACDASDASHFVFRHNIVEWSGDNASMMGTHGAQLDFDRRSNRWFEFYDNVGASPKENRWTGFSIRGGDGVIFNNRVSDTGKFCVLGYEPFSRKFNMDAEYPAKDQTRSLHLWDNWHEKGKEDQMFFLSTKHEQLFEEGRDYFFKKRSGYTPFQYPHPMRKS